MPACSPRKYLPRKYCGDWHVLSSAHAEADIVTDGSSSGSPLCAPSGAYAKPSGWYHCGAQRRERSLREFLGLLTADGGAEDDAALRADVLAQVEPQLRDHGLDMRRLLREFGRGGGAL